MTGAVLRTHATRRAGNWFNMLLVTYDGQRTRLDLATNFRAALATR